VKNARIALVGLAMLIPPTAAWAQEESPRPTLGGHTFIPNAITEDPFINTWIHNRLGVGQALNVETIPEFEIDTLTLGGSRGNLFFAVLDLEYRQKVLDWLVPLTS